MKTAVIDLGTNTFHLIIAQTIGKKTNIIYKTNVPVKLGENITKNNEIIPTAFNRGIICLQEFKLQLNKYQVNKVKAVATSGIRSTTNGLAFIQAAKAQTDITINIITGNKEAQYIYQGVKWSGAITNKALIIDIGGGSTEFILCDAEKLIWKKSYNIGAARLMQTFFKSDPINPQHQQDIKTYLQQELKELFAVCQKETPQTLIGSAGAFETFATMILPEINLENINKTNISISAYKKLAKNVIASSHQEREKMQSLIPLRVDMIVMAAILTNYVLAHLKIKNLTLSTYDLKMGVLKSLIPLSN